MADMMAGLHHALFTRDASSDTTEAMLLSSNLTEVAWYYTEHPVPQTFNPGIIVASIAVAILGSYSTLLLLGKRTSNKGARNITLLALAATTMACVGIWGMHFIGMHMQLQPVPGLKWYIQFNPGFTVFSLFIPTIALVLAFFFVDDQVAFSAWRVCLSGVITGCIISLMHYSASFKCNFLVSYSAVHTVFAIVLACAAATLALFSFFRFRAQWEDSWWKRLVCACILGVGVAGMHYLGATGTSYYVPRSASLVPEVLNSGSYQSTVVTIAIGVMCFAIIVFSTFIAVSDVLTARDARSKAKKVVVCSATFDKQGRLLVKQDGTMPMMVIETPIQTKDMLDALDNRQPTFQWLYAISWDWDIVAPFLRAMTAFFGAKDQANQRTDGSKEKSRLLGGKAASVLNKRRDSFDALGSVPTRGPGALAEFRDRFIDAASQLSVELDIPFQHIGVLYDHVFPTGTRKAALAGESGDLKAYYRSANKVDDESSINGHVPSIFGDGENEEEGLMLFLVRELPSNNGKDSLESAEKYRQRGYRMTETRFLAGILADRVAVTKTEMESMLDSLRLYAKRGTRPVVQPGGVYAGLFGVRPSTSRQGGLDVLVYNFARHQIPAYRLPDVARITPEMRSFLRMLDQMTMEEAMKTCERESIRSGERRRYVDGQQPEDKSETMDESTIELMIQFQTALFIALDALHNSVRFYPRIAQTARISAEVLEVPSSLDDSTAPAEMILIQAVLPEARPRPNSYSEMVSAAAADTLPTDKPGNGTPFVFTPYNLFSKSQMMLLRGRQADDFEHEVVIELRRRYPSSLLQEAEERHSSPFTSRKAPSLLSQDMSFVTEEKKFEDDTTEEDSQSIKNSNPLASFRRWGEKAVHKSSKDNMSMHESIALSPRRHSVSSVKNAPKRASYNDAEEMKQVGEGPMAGITRPRSPISPSSTVTAVNSPERERLPAYSQTTPNQSLGIRRFTEGGLPARGTSSNGRFVQPADEVIVEESGNKDSDQSDELASDDSAGGDHGAASPAQVTRKRPPSAMPAAGGLAAAAPISDSRTARSNSRRRPATAAPGAEPEPQGALVAPLPRTYSRPQGASRPSTAPSGGRRETALMRPRTAESVTGSPRVLSQRHAANATLSNEASLIARLRSDDWSSRQLQSLERGPSGSLLLGVEF